VARTWLEVEVVLVGVAEDEQRDPGRVFAVGPSHTFGQLADAINAAFGRWDLSHLHEFELAGGRKIGLPDDEFAPDVVWEDQAQVKVASALEPGEEFSFTFDFGEGWLHRCRVMAQKLEPREVLGDEPSPRAPVAMFGWGWLPDQYRREQPDEGVLDELD
jgi:Plasmid pRiA4b ORF-3-like protein